MPRIAFFLSLCAVILCQTRPLAAQDDAIPWPTQEWQVSSPEAQGMNSAPLTAMIDTVIQKKINIRSVLVIRNGSLVLEAYRYPYTYDDLQTVYSVTKSFASALVGIAIDKGYIEGLNHSLIDLFP